MKKRILLLPLFTILLSFFVITELSAIPAFARKYQISCQVCHNPFPSLKPFGEDFAGNGFRMTEYEAPRYFIQTGDDKLSLLRELPLAIRIDGIATINSGNSGILDISSPSGIKILFGGELSDKLSYYFYFYMSEWGNVAGVEDAFITYSDLFGTGINISAGQFQACDPFYKRELRLTVEDIEIIKAVPGTSQVSLKYERGLMLDYEIPGLGTGIVAELLNGNGLNHGGDESLFDKDKYKNLLVYLAQPVGKVLTVGLLAYTGREIVSDAPDKLACGVRMLGPAVNLDFNERLRINAQYIFRTDSRIYDPENTEWRMPVKTSGGYFEMILTPRGDQSKWYMAGLLNYVESDFSPLNYKSATINAGHLLRRNIRLFSEFTLADDGDRYGKFSLGFTAAF